MPVMIMIIIIMIKEAVPVIQAASSHTHAAQRDATFHKSGLKSHEEDLL
jgi:hypothetical protein